MRIIGRGQMTLKMQAKGELCLVKSIQDVIRLWREGAEGKIVLVEDAGITTLGPILSRLAGVVCMSGGLGSHLAIVTREFSIPALMGTKVDAAESLDKRNVVIQPAAGEENDGFLLLVE